MAIPARRGGDGLGVVFVVPADLLVGDDSRGVALVDHLVNELAVHLRRAWAGAGLDVVHHAACRSMRFLAKGTGNASGLVCGAIEMHFQIICILEATLAGTAPVQTPVVALVHVSSGLLLSMKLFATCFAAVFGSPMAVFVHMLVHKILVNGREVARLALVDLPVVEGVHVLGGS